MDKDFAYSFLNYQKTDNFWCDLHPYTKLIVCLLVAVTSVVTQNWLYCLPLCLVIFAFSLTTGKFKQFWKIWKPILIFMFGLNIIFKQFLSTPADAHLMFSLFGWNWYWEHFYSGLNLATYMSSFSGALLLFFTTTETRDILYVLEKSGMSHVVSYILLSALQSIIDLRKMANTIMESQRSRGIETEGNLFVRAKAFIPILGPLLLSSFSGAEEKSIAMDARAFSAECEHTFLRRVEPIKRKDIIWILIFLILFIGFWALKLGTGLSCLQ